MNHQRAIRSQRKRRRFRVRKRLTGTAEQPRLSVHRTLKHIYAQVVDDVSGKTLASASTRDKDVGSSLKTGGNIDAATAIGTAIAKKATAAGIDRVCFDRGEYKYHGRVAALAAAAREAGLQF